MCKKKIGANEVCVMNYDRVLEELEKEEKIEEEESSKEENIDENEDEDDIIDSCDENEYLSNTIDN